MAFSVLRYPCKTREVLQEAMGRVMPNAMIYTTINIAGQLIPYLVTRITKLAFRAYPGTQV